MRFEMATVDPPLVALREHLRIPTQQLLQIEAEATAIRYFSLVLVPGLLQTEAYARAVFRDTPAPLSAAAIETRLAARLRRRDQVIYRPDPPDLLVLLDESVLHRAVGGVQVMVEQLQDLLRISQQSKMQLRVVPAASAAAIALLGPFTIIDLDGSDDALLYRETPVTDEIVDTPAVVNAHSRTFESLWGHALSDQESSALIRGRVTALLAEAHAADS
jgi:hypothetical protein